MEPADVLDSELRTAYCLHSPLYPAKAGLRTSLNTAESWIGFRTMWPLKDHGL